MNSSFKSAKQGYTLMEPIELTSSHLIEVLDYTHWRSLPYDICNGLICKRIKTPPTYEGFLLKYETGCKTTPHVNTEEYEMLNVKSGSITNLITGRTYLEGQTMVINKDEVHEIYCNSEAYIYFVTTQNKSELDKLI